jgi:cobalt-precorrin-5B (C1)-methyltransferase
MNTHSKTADCRAELFAAFAAAEGASKETVLALLDSMTTDACLSILQQAGLFEPVVARMLDRIDYHLTARADGMPIGAVMFSNQYGLLGMTKGAPALINQLQQQEGARG